MGKDFSKNLGVHYNLVLFGGLTIAAVITASIVSIVGSISYIGLIVPNIVAMFKGDKIRGTLADTAMFGALFVLVCDIIARLVIHPYELPIELIIGIVGSILFVAMLMYRLQAWPQGDPAWEKEGGCGMNTCVKRRNTAALFVLGALVVLSVIAYMTVELNFSNERLLRFAMKRARRNCLPC